MKRKDITGGNDIFIIDLFINNSKIEVLEKSGLESQLMVQK